MQPVSTAPIVYTPQEGTQPLFCTLRHFFFEETLFSSMDDDILNRLSSFIQEEFGIPQDEVDLASDLDDLGLSRRDIGYMARKFAAIYKFTIDEDSEDIYTVQDFVEWVEDNV